MTVRFSLRLVMIAAIALCGVVSRATSGQRAAYIEVERVAFDWDHSGAKTTFILSHKKGSDGGADRLVIERSGRQPSIFVNHEDAWGPLAANNLSDLQKQNLVPSTNYMLFVSAGQSPNTRVYLILKGNGFGCCVGSLTVLTSDSDGKPQIVFHANEHLLEAIIPTKDGTGIQLIGQPSDSEAWALDNAQSYDPYQVYLLKGTEPAQYDLDLSKAYTRAHYCQWHGPRYDERFAAVGKTTGATHCRVMSKEEFAKYRQKHPQMFPEP